MYKLWYFKFYNMITDISLLGFFLIYKTHMAYTLEFSSRYIIDYQVWTNSLLEERKIEN